MVLTLKSQKKYNLSLNEEVPSVLGSQILSWNESGSLPLLPTSESRKVFVKLRDFPDLSVNKSSEWRAIPYGEAHAGNCHAKFLVNENISNSKTLPVYKGVSFDLDQVDTGNYYGYADQEKMSEWLDAARKKRLEGKAFSEFPVEWCNNKDTVHG